MPGPLRETAINYAVNRTRARSWRYPSLVMSNAEISLFFKGNIIYFFLSGKGFNPDVEEGLPC